MCKHPYSFTPVYAPGAPARLPPHELLWGLARRCAKGIGVAHRVRARRRCTANCAPPPPPPPARPARARRHARRTAARARRNVTARARAPQVWAVSCLWLAVVPWVTCLAFRLAFLPSLSAAAASAALRARLTPLAVAFDCVAGSLLSVLIVLLNMGFGALKDLGRAALRGLEQQLQQHGGGHGGGAAPAAAAAAAAEAGAPAGGAGGGEQPRPAAVPGGPGGAPPPAAQPAAGWDGGGGGGAVAGAAGAGRAAPIDEPPRAPANDWHDLPFEVLVGLAGPWLQLLETIALVIIGNLAFVAAAVYAPLSLGRRMLDALGARLLALPPGARARVAESLAAAADGPAARGALALLTAALPALAPPGGANATAAAAAAVNVSAGAGGGLALGAAGAARLLSGPGGVPHGPADAALLAATWHDPLPAAWAAGWERLSARLVEQVRGAPAARGAFGGGALARGRRPLPHCYAGHGLVPRPLPTPPAPPQLDLPTTRDVVATALGHGVGAILAAAALWLYVCVRLWRAHRPGAAAGGARRALQLAASLGRWAAAAAALAARGAKLALLLALQLGLFPLAVGAWLDVCALPLTAGGAGGRAAAAAAAPTLSAFLHWALGVAFMLALGFAMAAARQVLRPGALPFIRVRRGAARAAPRVRPPQAAAAAPSAARPRACPPPLEHANTRARPRRTRPRPGATPSRSSWRSRSPATSRSRSPPPPSTRRSASSPCTPPRAPRARSRRACSRCGCRCSTRSRRCLRTCWCST